MIDTLPQTPKTKNQSTPQNQPPKRNNTIFLLLILGVGAVLGINYKSEILNTLKKNKPETEEYHNPAVNEEGEGGEGADKKHTKDGIEYMNKVYEIIRIMKLLELTLDDDTETPLDDGMKETIKTFANNANDVQTRTLISKMRELLIEENNQKLTDEQYEIIHYLLEAISKQKTKKNEILIKIKELIKDMIKDFRTKSMKKIDFNSPDIQQPYEGTEAPIANIKKLQSGILITIIHNVLNKYDIEWEQVGHLKTAPSHIDAYLQEVHETIQKTPQSLQDMIEQEIMLQAKIKIITHELNDLDTALDEIQKTLSPDDQNTIIIAVLNQLREAKTTLSKTVSILLKNPQYLKNETREKTLEDLGIEVSEDQNILQIIIQEIAQRIKDTEYKIQTTYKKNIK